MSKDLWETLIQALKNPKRYEAYFAERNMTEVLQAQNEPIITFTEDDLIIGMTGHNCPLYIMVESESMIINQILIDLGSSLNLLSFKALRSLCLDVQHLVPKKLMSTSRGKKKEEDSDPDYDYDSTYVNNVQCVFSRRIDSMVGQEDYSIKVKSTKKKQIVQYKRHSKNIVKVDQYPYLQTITSFLPEHLVRKASASIMIERCSYKKRSHIHYAKIFLKMDLPSNFTHKN
ncbi:hypothetical protein M5K25_018827 [Dendrobium thyrsiflorum]|uniref:Uncharacterized protein n=1 Tax=Dendrobium thyrsiflorum TaxID=117978 RepID=A0ABD0UDE6_DENTH